MAAPNLQGEGTINANTTGSLGIGLASHLTDDILVVSLVFFGPNAAGTTDPGTPAGWNKIQAFTPGGGGMWMFWKRATSGAETNPTFTRGADWDTGTDTCFAGRAYTIRGCITTGNPWDDIQFTAPTASANQAFPAITVSGSERMVVQFFMAADDTSAGAAPSGWTAGTAATTTTGTDAGFQTFRKDNVASSTSADTSNAAATAQGYLFNGISFKPPAAAAGKHLDVIGTLL